MTLLKESRGICASAPRTMGPLNVAVFPKVTVVWKSGTDAVRKVTGLAKLTLPVMARSCAINEDVKFVIVMLLVVRFSSLIMRTSFAVIAVTAGNSLTLILANFLAE